MMGNFASFLFSEGKHKDAIPLLKSSLETAGEMSLKAELQFYRLAHCPEQSGDARRELEKLISEGAKSEYWSFQSNIDRAAIDEHPNISQLCHYAEVITGLEHRNPLECKKSDLATKPSKAKSTRRRRKKKGRKR